MQWTIDKINALQLIIDTVRRRGEGDHIRISELESRCTYLEQKLYGLDADFSVFTNPPKEVPLYLDLGKVKKKGVKKNDNKE